MTTDVLGMTNSPPVIGQSPARLGRAAPERETILTTRMIVHLSVRSTSTVGKRGLGTRVESSADAGSWVDGEQPRGGTHGCSTEVSPGLRLFHVS